MNGMTYWLGTDSQGRDMLSAILYGLRTSLMVGLSATIGALFVGISAGLLAAQFGGAVDASALSSYVVGQDSLQTVSASAPTHQTAACWVVVTGNGKYVYTTNAGSGSVSGYAVARDGSLTLLDADGRTGITGASPTDAALSRNSQYLYVLNAASDTISAFAVERDGSLTDLGQVSTPATAVGIAAH